MGERRRTSAEAELALEFSQRLQALEGAHDGRDNFCNERAPARALRGLVPPTGRVPAQANAEFVRVVVRCRVGRPSGVANAAKPYYDEMIALFSEPQAKVLVQYPGTAEAERLKASNCVAEYRGIVTEVRKRVVNRPTQDALEAVWAATDAQIPHLHKDTAYLRLLSKL